MKPLELLELRQASVRIRIPPREEMYLQTAAAALLIVKADRMVFLFLSYNSRMSEGSFRSATKFSRLSSHLISLSEMLAGLRSLKLIPDHTRVWNFSRHHITRAVSGSVWKDGSKTHREIAEWSDLCEILRSKSLKGHLYTS